MLFQSSVCQSSKQEGQDRWTAAFRLSLDRLEGDIAPGLGTIEAPHCAEAGTPGTNAGAFGCVAAGMGEADGVLSDVSLPRLETPSWFALLPGPD